MTPSSPTRQPNSNIFPETKELSDLILNLPTSPHREKRMVISTQPVISTARVSNPPQNPPILAKNPLRQTANQTSERSRRLHPPMQKPRIPLLRLERKLVRDEVEKPQHLSQPIPRTKRLKTNAKPEEHTCTKPSAATQHPPRK